MIITKRAIPRRTVLRGLGASLALPLLDGMVPALTALSKTEGRPIRRLGVVYVPNGMAMASWTPPGPGSQLQLSPILQPLEAFRERLLVLSGLDVARGGGVHAGASTKFLTGIVPKSADGNDVLAGVSMDQIAAKASGQHTQLASLELSLDSRDFAGSCDTGYSCAYTTSIAWRSPSTPLPMENNPRVVFERLFGDSGTTDPVARRARREEENSILDSITDKIARLRSRLAADDRGKLHEYLEAVRDVERRIQRAEQQGSVALPIVAQPAGIPATFEEHAKLMFDLQTLAYQSDLTRVITFMVSRELSGRSYPEIGVPDSHHPLSHHQNDRTKISGIAKINAFHTTLFAYYLGKLQSTREGNGSLLDNVSLVYGAGMADSNRHTPTNLPILVTGGAVAPVKGGRHLQCPAGTPLANLHLTLLESVGVPQEHLADSTGRLEFDRLPIA